MTNGINIDDILSDFLDDIKIALNAKSYRQLEKLGVFTKQMLNPNLFFNGFQKVSYKLIEDKNIKIFAKINGQETVFKNPALSSQNVSQTLIKTELLRFIYEHIHDVIKNNLKKEIKYFLTDPDLNSIFKRIKNSNLENKTNFMGEMQKINEADRDILGNFIENKEKFKNVLMDNEYDKLKYFSDLLPNLNDEYVDLVKSSMLPPKHKRAVIAIICEHAPYTGTEYEEKFPYTIPCVLFQNRWDGLFGLVAGWIDDGETPIQAAKREMSEEIGFEYAGKIDVIDEDDNFFGIKVDWETLKKIIQNAPQSEHFGAEVHGLFAAPIVNYAHAAAFDNLMNSPMPATTKNEIINLIHYYGYQNSLTPAKHNLLENNSRCGLKI